MYKIVSLLAVVFLILGTATTALSYSNPMSMPSRSVAIDDHKDAHQEDKDEDRDQDDKDRPSDKKRQKNSKDDKANQKEKACPHLVIKPRPGAHIQINKNRFSIKGVIESVSDKQIVVEGLTVIVDPTVVPKLEIKGKLAVGATVSAEGRVDDNCSLIAQKIKVHEKGKQPDRTVTATPTHPIAPTATSTIVPTTVVTPTLTAQPTITPTNVVSPTLTVAPTMTPTQQVTATHTAVATFTPTIVATQQVTATQTTVATLTPTPTPSGMASAEQKLEIKIKQDEDKNSVKVEVKAGSGISLEGLLKMMQQLVASFLTNLG